MCNSCGVSGCSCNKKRHCSAVDQVLVPGPQGVAGVDGADGAVGPQGPAGAGGGLQYEHWFTNPLDTVWQNAETIQPEFNYAIPADGIYQIHINLRTQCAGNGFTSFGSLHLYVNNVIVDIIDINFPNIGVLPPGERVESDNVFFWRGTILTGQNVEVKHVAQGSSLIVSAHGNMLINKES